MDAAKKRRIVMEEAQPTSSTTNIINENLKRILKKIIKPVAKLVLKGLGGDVPFVNPTTYVIEFYKVKKETQSAWQSSHQHEHQDSSQQISFYQLTEIVMKNRVTGIVGPPGSGKTTLSIRLSTELCARDGILSLHFKFHEMNYGDMKMTLKEFLIDYHHPELSKEERQVLFEWIQKNPEKCHFGLDGGDQATFSLDEVKPLPVSIDTPLKIDQLIANVLHEIFLPGVHISLTSRPHTFVTWPEEMHPQKFIQVRELSEPDMKGLFYGFAAEKAKSLWHTLETKSPRLLSLCRVPIMLQLILLAFLGTEDTSELQTVTQVFTVLLEQYCRSAHDEKGSTHSLKDRLCRLAYNATKQRTVVIEYSELTSKGLKDVDVQAIVIAIPGHMGSFRILEGDKKLIFTHQLLQEYHTAYHISHYMSSEEFRKVVEEVVTDPHWAMVRRFLCGLLLGGNFQVPSSSDHENLDKAVMFYSPSENLQGSDSEAFQGSAKGKAAVFYSHPEHLQGSHREDKATMVSSLSENLQGSGSGVFQRSAKDKAAMFYSYPEHLQGSDSEVFQGLCREDKSSIFYWHLLETFRQSSETNEFVTASGLSELLNLIVDLQESNDAVLRSFAKHFPAKADFTGQPIGASESHALAQILKHVEKPIGLLNLSDCNLSSQSLQHICDVIGDKKLKMQGLALSGNQISLHHAEKIASNIENIESLGLQGCKLSEESTEVICNAISEKKCKMQLLNLSGNQISLHHAEKIASNIENIESLRLWNCGVTEEGEEVIRSKLREFGFPLDRVMMDVTDDNMDLGDDSKPSPMQTDSMLDRVMMDDSDDNMDLDDDLKPSPMQTDSMDSHEFKFTDSVNIGTEGSALKFCRCVVDFPPGSLAEPTTITLTYYYGRKSTQDSFTPVLKCEPHGLKFRKPVTMTLPTCFYTDDGGPEEVMVQRSEDGLAWQDYQTVTYRNDEEITFEVKKFSWYQVIPKCLWTIWRAIKGGPNWKKRKSVYFSQPILHNQDIAKMKLVIQDFILPKPFTSTYNSGIPIKPKKELLMIVMQTDDDFKVRPTEVSFFGVDAEPVCSSDVLIENLSNSNFVTELKCTFANLEGVSIMIPIAPISYTESAGSQGTTAGNTTSNEQKIVVSGSNLNGAEVGSQSSKFYYCFLL